MEEYARTEFGIYKVIGKYERNRYNDLCVQLGDFYTGEFEGEEYESNLKVGNLIDLLEVGDIIFVYGGFIEIDYIYINDDDILESLKKDLKNGLKLKQILTHQQFEANAYKVKGE